MKIKITQHSFGCQTIEEEFTGKNLTLFGGLGLVSKFFGGLRLCKTLRILDKQFPRRENGYEVSHLILALIYGLIESIGTRRQQEFLGHIEGESAYCAGKADKSQWQMDIAIK